MITCEAKANIQRNNFGLMRQIPIVNKDIFKGDTLLLPVSSTPAWHPLREGEEDEEDLLEGGMEGGRAGGSQDKICPGTLKQSSNREAHWPRRRGS